MKKAFVLYLDYMGHLELLTDEALGKLTRAIFLYEKDGTIPNFDGMPELNMAFSFIKANLDRDSDKWEKRAQQSRANGALGGRPKSNNLENQTGYLKTCEDSLKPKEPVIATDNVTANANDNVIANVNAGFNRFWEAYPRKIKQKQAEDVWLSINPDASLQEKIFAALEKHKKTDNWTKNDGQYIPYPATWLNDKRWNDVVEVPSSTKTNTKTNFFN